MSGSTKNRFIKEAGGSGLLYHTHGHPVDGSLVVWLQRRIRPRCW